MQSNLIDWWGNPAIDYGIQRDLEKKYHDKIFVAVTNVPFGSCYVLFICSYDEYDTALEYLREYNTMMEKQRITAFGLGIALGEDILATRLDGFQGGSRL